MQVGILSVPYDSGRYHERMGLGPGVLFRECLEPLFLRRGINCRHEEIISKQLHSAEIESAFELCATVSHRVHALREEDCFPILLSGNCDIAIGGICGCGAADTSVAWFDAHGEANTPDTTTSGFLDGMGIAILTGQCWTTLARTIPCFDPVPGAHILLVGARDLEPDEVTLLDRTGVTRVSGTEHLGSLLASLTRQVDGVYLPLDLDVLDPTEAIANQWAPPSGLTIESIKEAVKTIQAHTRIKALGIAAYDPEADHDGRALAAASSITEFLLGTDRKSVA